MVGDCPSPPRRPLAVAGLFLLAALFQVLRQQSLREVPPAIPELPTAGYSAELAREIEARLAALRGTPFDAVRNGELALLLHAHQELLPAEQFYHRAALFDPRSPRWPYLRALTLCALNRTPEALASLRLAVRLAPGDHVVQTRFSEYLAAEGRHDEALAAARDAVAGGSDEAAFRLARLLASAQPRDALAALRRLPPGAQQYREVLYLFAELSRRTGDREAAARYARDSASAPSASWDDPYLASVEQLRTGSPRVWVDRGLAAERAGHVDQAVEAYRKALSLDSRFVPAHINLIAVLGRNGRPDEALRHYEAALALDAGFEELHYNHGVLRVSLRQWLVAGAAFEQALRLNPSSVEARYNLGYCLLQSGQPAVALSHFQKALALNPGHTLALIQIGALHLKAGRRAAAAAQFERALAVDSPQRPEHLYAIANAYFRAGFRAESLRHALQARDAATKAGLTQLARNAQEAVTLLTAR